MKNSSKRESAGFAVVETILILVILAAIIGIAVYVVHQRNSANKTLNTSGSASSSVKAPAGTSASIDQLTQQAAQNEAGIDNSADTSTQQTSTSANGAISNMGGAYNESSL